MRNLASDLITEIGKDHVNIAILGEFNFASGVQNLWAGPEGHVLDYDSKQWTAIGEVGQIDKIGEAQGLADSRTTVSLRVNSENVDQVDVEDSRGRIATITLLVLSDAGEIIGPINFVTTMGKVDVKASVSTDESGAKIVNESLALELLNETAKLANRHFVRNTHEAALRIDATDNGFEFIADPDASNVGLTSNAYPDGRRRGRSPR